MPVRSFQGLFGDHFFELPSLTSQLRDFTRIAYALCTMDLYGVSRIVDILEYPAEDE